MKCKYCQKEISPKQLGRHEKCCKISSEFKGVLSLRDLENIDLENLPLTVLKKCKVKLTCNICNRPISKSLAAWKIRPLTACAMCRRKEHLLEKYGVTNVGQLASVKEKYKQTCLQKFGVEHASQANVIKEKAKQTCREKYGTDYWQCSKVYKTGLRERISKACKKYRYDNITFDSSWELALWIYAKDHSEEIEREPCQFEYEYNGAMHTYIPDFRYKGKLLEIKGDHYKDDKTKAKLLVAKENDIQILYQKDVQPYLDYMKQKEGRLWRLKYKNR